jgi:hypothetical protein
LQVARRKRMPEIVEEEIRTVWSFQALIAMLRDALPAIHFRVQGDALQLEFVPLVWSAGLVWKHQRICIQLL